MDLINVLKGIACGIIYVSSLFWTIVLAFKYVDVSIILVLITSILTNIVVGLLMASTRHRYAVYKWLISLPVGLITFLAYKEINFISYWLNKIYPDYGRLSAGGGFALLFYIILYILSFLIAIITSFWITDSNIKKL